MFQDVTYFMFSDQPPEVNWFSRESAHCKGDYNLFLYYPHEAFNSFILMPYAIRFS